MKAKFWRDQKTYACFLAKRPCHSGGGVSLENFVKNL